MASRFESASMRALVAVALVLAGGAARAADEPAAGATPGVFSTGRGSSTTDGDAARPPAPAPAGPNAAASLENAPVGAPGPGILTGAGVSSPMNGPTRIQVGR
jgi:hypothetical protein